MRIVQVYNLLDCGLDVYSYRDGVLDESFQLWIFIILCEGANTVGPSCGTHLDGVAEACKADVVLSQIDRSLYKALIDHTRRTRVHYEDKLISRRRPSGFLSVRFSQLSSQQVAYKQTDLI